MAQEKKRTYQSTTLGLPPLQMVLVHAKNDAQNARVRRSEAPTKDSTPEETPVEKQEAIRKIIEHLQASDQ
jgi:hypothetical protein